MRSIIEDMVTDEDLNAVSPAFREEYFRLKNELARLGRKETERKRAEYWQLWHNKPGLMLTWTLTAPIRWLRWRIQV